jgi:hypothetical protein
LPLERHSGVRELRYILPKHHLAIVCVTADLEPHPSCEPAQTSNESRHKQAKTEVGLIKRRHDAGTGSVERRFADEDSRGYTTTRGTNHAIKRRITMLSSNHARAPV